ATPPARRSRLGPPPKGLSLKLTSPFSRAFRPGAGPPRMDSTGGRPTETAPFFPFRRAAPPCIWRGHRPWKSETEFGEFLVGLLVSAVAGDRSLGRHSRGSGSGQPVGEPLQGFGGGQPPTAQADGFQPDTANP